MVSRDALDFFQSLKQITDRTGDDLRPVQAWVVDEVAGQVRLRFGGETAAEAGEQRYARNGGAPYAPDTEVMAQPVGRGWFVLGPVQRGAGTSTPSVEGSGALPGAPVLDLLAVVVTSLRWQGTVRVMSSKQRALALRMIRQFPGLLQLASGGRVGCRVRLIEQADTWDLDAAIAVGKAEVTTFGTTGSWITDQGAQSLWGTYAGRTYDCRMLFLGTSQMDSTANEITRRDFPYSFLNPEDTWYDGDRAAGRVSDQMVHAYMRQLEEILRDHGVTPTSVDGYAAAGYSVDPVRGLMPWFQQWWRTADLSGLVDDGRVPDIDPRTSLVPFTRVDLDDSWGSLQAATTAIGGGATGQQVITTYLNGALVKANPDNIDIRSGTGISVTPGTHDGGVEYVINATGTGGTSAVGNRLEWYVLIVIPKTVKYQGVTKTMTTKEWDMSVRVAEQFAALMELAAGHVMDFRVRTVFRTTVWDLDADIAAGAQAPEPWGGGGAFYDGGTADILLNSYNGDMYDARVVFQGRSITDCSADGLTSGNRPSPGLSTVILGDSTYDYYAGNNILADVLVHEHNHQIEWRLQQAGVPSTAILVDGRLQGVPESGPGSVMNQGTATGSSRINWWNGYVGWWDQITDYIQDNTIRFRSVPPTFHADAVPIYNRFVQPDNGWGIYGATGGTATGDYNQSIEVYGEGLGLVSGNPSTLDFKAPLVVTEPTPDIIQVSVSGERRVATHYRNVAVYGHDGLDVQRWVLASSGALESYDASSVLRGSLGNGSLSLYDAAGVRTVNLPNVGTPRFSTTPTVGPSGSAVAVALTGHGHTSLDISDFAERAQDAVAAMLAAGTGVTLAYDDTANTLTITGTAGGGTTDLEAVRDAIGVALIGAGVITVTVNDAADTITISSTATANSTDAALRDRTTHTGTQAATSITDLTKSSVGLSRVDNTADTAKPVSTAQQTALDSKAASVHDHPNIAVATEYRNVNVFARDGLNVYRWGLFASGAFESYDASAVTRLSMGNGSIALYDAAGLETVFLPNTGTPRFAVTPTVGPAASAVPLVLQGHTHPTTGFTPAVLPGEYFGPIHQLGGTPSTQAFGGGNLYLYPVNIDRAQTWASMALRITTSAAGNIRFGIYASDPLTGMATGATIREVVSTTTTTAGVKIISLGTNWTNAPGKYWLGWITDVSQTIQSVPNAGASFPGVGSSAADVAGSLPKLTGYGRTQAYGALPSSPVRAYTLSSIPFLFLIAA